MVEEAITTFSKAFLDTLILSTLENLKDNECIDALTHLSTFSFTLGWSATFLAASHQHYWGRSLNSRFPPWNQDHRAPGASMAWPPTSTWSIHQEDRYCCFMYCRGDESSTFALLPYWATYFVTVSVVSENGSCWNTSLNNIFNHVDPL